MQKYVSLFSTMVITLSMLVFSSCKDDDTPIDIFEEVVVVANRADGSLSFIDGASNQVLETLPIANSEPMYVVYVSATDKIYVGDRSQNMVHVIDPGTRTVETSIAVGNGVFHMWADGQGKELWVNNDVDLTVSVIRLSDNTVVETINLGIKPHDIFVDNSATTAYISIFSGDPNTPDSIFAYSTSTYTRTAGVAVGKDPHVFHLPANNQLYVPCQSGNVFILDGNTLSETNNISIKGSHGIFAAPAQDFAYVANIEDAELYTINIASGAVQGSALSTPVATPHNLTVNEAGDKLFVTHSGGSANTTSVYTLTNGTIAADASVTIGTNPFGLAYYKRKQN